MIEIDLGGARALFTDRLGGVSGGPYGRLNLGPWTDDEPAAIAANRGSVALRVAARLAQGRQVHGADVTVIDRLPPAPASGDGALERAWELTSSPAAADGQATALHGVAPMVVAADCVPVVLAGAGAVAAVHAGWRGLDAGVIAAGVRALRELGADGMLHAVVGPCARGCCYEVGEEVQARFADYAARRPRNRLDLAAIAIRQLAQAGVANIEDLCRCTICDEQRYFSHRRDEGITGRQAGLVWLT